MPPPDQLFQRLLRDSFDDTHRSPTPRASSSSWPTSTGTPSRIGHQQGRSAGTPTTKHLRADIAGVRSSNVTTPHRTISQRDNPFSNASSSSSAQRRFGRPSDTSHRSTVNGTHASPSGDRKDFVVTHRETLQDSEGPSRLIALEHVLEDEMEKLRLLTEAVEQRIAKVMSLDEQRQAILRAAQRQQSQQLARQRTFEYDSQVVSSSAYRTTAADTPENHRRYDENDDDGDGDGANSRENRLRRHRDPTSGNYPARQEEGSSLALADLSTVTGRYSTQRTPKTPQGPSSAAHGHDGVGVLARMDGVTPLTASRVSRRGLDARQSDADLFVVTLSNDDVNALHGPSHTNVQHRLHASEPRSLVRQHDSPHSTSASRLLTQREMQEQRSASATLLLAQTHAAQADVLKYEEDLLSFQDALIGEQRRSQSADQRSVDALMHLRVVVRDELSKCKKRRGALQQLEAQLTLAAENR